MSTSINAQLTGTFTSDGTAVDISIPCGYTKIELVNLTDFGSAAANTNVMEAYGYSNNPDGYGIYVPKTSGAATLGTPTMVTSNGFSFLEDNGIQTPGASLTIATGISQATQAVVTTTATTGLANGDVVRVFNSTGMLQIGGLDFTISNLSAGSSYKLAYLDSSGFAAAATAGSVRRIPYNPRFYPRNRTITKVTSSGTSTIVTLSVDHEYVAGQVVKFIVPSAFGMIELDGLQGTVTAVGASDGVVTNTITVDIDSSGFTTFAFPTSALAATGVTFAQVVPMGESATAPYANLLDDAFENRSITGVTIGTSMQTSGSEYMWIASKAQAI